MSAQQSTLSTALRRSLVLVIVFVAMLCGATIVAMHRLEQQVERWSHIEELDAVREHLVEAVHQSLAQSLAGEIRLPSRDVRDAIDVMHDLVARIDRTDPEDVFGDEAHRLFDDATRLFLEAHEQSAESQALSSAFSDRQARFQQLVGKWGDTLNAWKRTASHDATQLGESQRVINIELRNLTSAFLATETLRRQVEAAQRLLPTSPEISLSTAAALDESGLPVVCDRDMVLEVGQLCAPSTRRMRNALNNLKISDTETLSPRLRDALRAIDGYVRAWDLRYETLSNRLSQSLVEAQVLRRRIRDLDDASKALDRISTNFLRMEANLATAMAGGVGLTESRKTAKHLEADLILRTRGLLTLQPGLGTDLADVVQLHAELTQAWEKFVNSVAARDSTFAAFDAKMSRLAAAVSSQAEMVRRSTSLWVNLFATGAFGAAATLVVAMIGMIALARRHFVAPLMDVTGSIDALASGQFNRKIKLTQRAFGFDRLGQSLEQLRSAMVERASLAASNERQKVQIEKNMKDLEKSSRETQWLAMHDPLTSLANRRHADLDLLELTRKGQSGGDFCLIHIDLDRFKEINDTLGHAAGDHILVEVAKLLDMRMSAGDRCYRIGGDEFLVARRGDASTATAVDFANAVIADLAQPIDFQGHSCRIGASLGIAFGRDTQYDAATCLVNADLALYQAKHNGRNRYRFFESELQNQYRIRKAQSDRIIAAVEAEAFVPFYQPQFYTDGLHLRGVETLCRWHDPERGWIPPSEFLELADELKLLGKIDQILFRKAAKDVARLKQAGVELPKISFNVTSDRLMYADLVTDLASAFDGRTRVAVELLESMSLDSLTDSVRWAIDALKEAGIEVEIDDFGSCRASVAGLIAVGPDAMKIDGSIILPLTSKPEQKKLVRAIIEIGRSLDIEVVAEGVETTEHIHMLTELGCDVLQGFGLARPMPVDDLLTFVTEKTIEKTRHQLRTG